MRGHCFFGPFPCTVFGFQFAVGRYIMRMFGLMILAGLHGPMTKERDHAYYLCRRPGEGPFEEAEDR